MLRSSDGDKVGSHRRCNGFRTWATATTGSRGITSLFLANPNRVNAYFMNETIKTRSWPHYRYLGGKGEDIHILFKVSELTFSFKLGVFLPSYQPTKEKLPRNYFFYLSTVPCIFYYFVHWPTKAQLFHKLSHSYMFRHYRVIFRELVINTLSSSTSVFISVINQLDAENICLTISLFHASTCFEHHVLIIRRSKLHYTASV